MSMTASRWGAQRVKPVHLILVVLSSLVVIWLLRQSPLLATAGIVGAAAVAIVLVRPEIGLILVIVALPLQRSVFGDYGLVVSWATVLVALLAFLPQLPALLRDFRLRDRITECLYLALWVYVALSLYADASILQGGDILVSPLAGGGLAHLRYVLQTMLFFTATALLLTSAGRLRLVTRALWAVVAVTLVIGIYDLSYILRGSQSYLDVLYARSFPADAGVIPSFQRIADFTLGGIYRGWTGGAQFANFLVSAMLILSPLAFFHVKASYRKVAAATLVLTALVVIYFTRSVGNWVALPVGLLVLGMLLSKKAPARASAIVLGLMIVLWVLFLFPSAFEMAPAAVLDKAEDLQMFLAEGRYPESRPIWIRLDLIKSGWWMFTQNPVFGMGFSTFGRYAPLAGYGGVFEIDSSSYSHNSYVSILGELGMVGMLLFLAFLCCVFKDAFLNMRRAQSAWIKRLQAGALAAIVANLVFMADYETWAFNLNFWLPVALTLGIKNTLRSGAGVDIGQDDTTAAHGATYDVADSESARQ